MRQFLTSLIEIIRREGIRFRVEVPGIGFQNGETGGFEKPTNGQEQFGAVIRALGKRGRYLETNEEILEFVNSCDSPVDSLCTVAHEFGHYMSFKLGQRGSSYEAALAKFNRKERLLLEEKHLILDEEGRAWDLGLVQLSRMGFTDSKAVQARKQDALKEYRRRLSLL